ncbi:MAG TPA: hypothetical protein ENN80_14420, partial [Candidatus Hydrogenedentes bacterium]|nr:hypothetical protein [Candidatus Hydrogenedentota bacterium]
MNKDEATRKFEQTKTLFTQHRYEETLAILDELDAAYPRTRRIMYPRALCLASMGRYREARQVCEELLICFNYPKAQALLAQIDEQEAALAQMPHAGQAPPARPMSIPMPLIQFDEDQLDYKPAAHPPLEVESSSNTLLYVVVAVVVVAAVGLAAVLLTRSDRGEPGQSSHQTPAAHQATAPATVAPEWHHDYSDALLQLRGQQNAPMLLFFYEDGSEIAERMDNEVFNEPSVLHFLKGWTLVRINVREEPGAAEEYHIETIPTTLILDPFGMEAYRQSGYVAARTLYDELSRLSFKPLKPPNFMPFLIALVLVVLVS